MLHQLNPRLLLRERMRRCQLGECQAACCLHGVWVDTQEAADILAHASTIAPHMPVENPDDRLWFDQTREPDEWMPSGEVVHSLILDAPWHYGSTACGFLRRDYKCALQVAADEAGLHPWRFKPFYCVLHPLDIDDQGRITLDETRLLLEEPASCLRPADNGISLLDTFEPELSYFLGNRGFNRLKNSQG